MCKFYEDIQNQRKKLDGIVNEENLSDENVIKESKNLDMLLNKRNFKCLDCKEKSKCEKICMEYSRKGMNHNEK